MRCNWLSKISLRYHSTSSRSVSKAIRISLQANDLSSAYFIFNSVKRPQLPDPPVPSRLTAHTLLHGLLRLGLRQRAYRLTQQLLADRVPIHGKTLQAVVHGILQPTTSSINAELYIRWKALLPTPQVLHLSPATSKDPGIRRAIQLVQAAREHNQQRSDRLFSAVIRACLLHGELLAASLIFTAIVKAYTVKDVIPPPQNTEDLSSPIQQINPQSKPLFPRPFLHAPIMVSIIKSILDILDKHNPADAAFQAALQALANLACLLDLRQLPFGEIACLVHALYACPKVQNKVWIRDPNSHPNHVKAYDYFHHVLSRLTNHLPTRIDSGKSPPSPRYVHCPKRRKVMPPLDIHTCNSLLHYTLRHRFSPKSAQKIIEYIHKHHAGPDVTTMNILVAAGRLLRLPGLAEETLSYLRLPLRGGNPSPLELEPSCRSWNHILLQLNPSDDSRFGKALLRLGNSSQDQLLKPLSSSSFSVQPDVVTINAWISYLVSTNRASVVSEFLYELIPELRGVNLPPLSVPSNSDQQINDRSACLKTVIRLGPWFLTAWLNAVWKSGQIRMAERVWNLAREAEEASWNWKEEKWRESESRVWGSGEPWLLPVHAYTIMLRCYGREEAIWRVRCDPRRRRHDHFLNKAYGVYKRLLMIPRTVEAKPLGNKRIPRPDERFFNAMLRMVTRRGEPQSVSSLATKKAIRPRSPKHWRQHIRFTKYVYAKSGLLRSHRPLNCSKLVPEIVEDIIRHGFEVPVGVQYLGVKSSTSPGSMAVSLRRFSGRASSDSHTRGVNRGPWGFPGGNGMAKTGSSPGSPFLFHVVKTKGLPVSRRGRWRRRAGTGRGVKLEQ
ncbi:hypothetical protein L218DRAFT_954730 [Marasmius fiardii PR-910]|nr:hypothetical protein L218DRAFT_954730 [Marasmius fiardii PR-910]